MLKVRESLEHFRQKNSLAQVSQEIEQRRQAAVKGGA
jgi:hypothetical protein